MVPSQTIKSMIASVVVGNLLMYVWTMIPVLRRFDHGQSSKLNCWSYKSADVDGMDHMQDPVDFCEWEIIFVGGEWGRRVHAGESISGAYLLISENISKYLGQEPNYVSIVSEFVVLGPKT